MYVNRCIYFFLAFFSCHSSTPPPPPPHALFAFRGFDKERLQWTAREAQLRQEISWQEAEKQKAVADRERLMVETASVSSEHSELARQRMNLLAERDQVMDDLKKLQTQHSKVRPHPLIIIHCPSHLTHSSHTLHP